MTQEALAERAGMTSQTISTAELGKKALRPENIVKLSRALGYPVLEKDAIKEELFDVIGFENYTQKRLMDTAATAVLLISGSLFDEPSFQIKVTTLVSQPKPAPFSVTSLATIISSFFSRHLRTASATASPVSAAKPTSLTADTKLTEHVRTDENTRYEICGYRR